MTDVNLSDSKQDAQGTPRPSRARRRFLGTGVLVAPAVLTLTSQPALGVTCFTPSRSLSKNTSVSQAGKYGDCTLAESPGNYMARATGQPGSSWPAAIPSTTPFHPTFSGWTYKKTVSGKVVSKTMMEVLNATNGNLPFFLIAAYLNASGGNGAQIPANVLTPAKILAIYTEWRTKGFYEPTAGIKWYVTEIKNYLFSNGIIK